MAPTAIVRHAKSEEEKQTKNSSFENQKNSHRRMVVHGGRTRKISFSYPLSLFYRTIDISKTTSTRKRGAVTDRFWIRGASPAYVFKELLENLTRELRVHSVMPEAKVHVVEFCQMLAKIAYAYAVGELGYGSFEPYMLPGILKAELTDCDSYIGSLEKDEHPSASLHELSLGESKPSNQIVVRVRLLSKLGTPTYFVVVGKNSDIC